MAVKEYLGAVCDIDDKLVHFTAVDWSRLVVAIIFAVRLSFPRREYQGYDAVWARHELDLGTVLDSITHNADLLCAGNMANSASATGRIMAVVRDRYYEKLAEIDSGTYQLGQPIIGCPMSDPGLGQLLPPLGAEDDMMLSIAALRTADEPYDEHSLYNVDWEAVAKSWTC